MTPYEINIPQAVLDDLQQRLRNTRWPDEVTGSDWQYGTSLAYLQQLVTYWRDEFDWRAQEATLNQFANYRVDVNGFGLHVIHERGKGDNPVPLLLSHGWPDSFFRFSKLIPLLTDPVAHGGRAEDAFDVIVPSLPGFGFSGRPTKPDMGANWMTQLMHQLMQTLG